MTAAASLAVLTLAAAAPALAQQAGAVGDVVVTARTTPPDQVVSLDKTGTPIADLPRSVQIIPRALIDLQGAVKLTDALRDVSGVAQGGQYAFGFFDRVIVRGLNASYLEDGLADGTSDLTGYVHSLLGVERVEILKGPGSAMYGPAEEGGAIDLVHYRPQDAPAAGVTEQVGSFASSTTDAYATGATGLADVDFRIDGEYQSSAGFRGQANRSGEILGALSYRPAGHDIELRVEYDQLAATPDAAGIPFSPPAGTGLPIGVPVTDAYFTPYAFADQSIERVFLSDAWTANDHLTVNVRSAWSHRDVDLARNSGGSVSLDDGEYALTNRQLREQDDHLGDLNLEIEPVWRFSTGRLGHVLVTGVETRWIDGWTWRRTADLPAVADIFDPAVDDGTLAGLSFKCDAKHSCDDAALSANFDGLYAIDQVTVTPSLQVRLSVRQDDFHTEAKALALVPANSGQEAPCDPPQAGACPLVPGEPETRNDGETSYDVGAVYFLFGGLSAFAGLSSDAYPIFNTEEPESVGQAPELGRQAELGLRYAAAGAWLTLSSSIYHVTRDNVFTLLTEPAPGGVGDVDVAQTFSYGVDGWESDLNLQPLRAWSVIANLALQDARITDYPQTPSDVGHAPPSVPAVLAYAFTAYDLTLPRTDTPLRLAIDVRYRSHEYADAGATRYVPGATLTDLVVELPRPRWTASVGVDNLTDQRNYLYAAGTGGGAEPGPGRTAFARLAARF